MKITFFEIQGWEKPMIKKALKNHKLTFIKEPLSQENIHLAIDSEVISIFIYSHLDKKLLNQLKKLKFIATRSTGYDHIDIKACKNKKIKVFNVPSYGENTVAEHTFALILALSRNVHRSYLRTLQRDYSIEGLKGFDLKGKTLGVIGAGRIGKHVIRIARGFEMNVIVADSHKDDFLAEQLNFKYTTLNELYKKADIITLHVPFTKDNYHLICKESLKLMKKSSILINTSRGQLVDTKALIWALDKKILVGVGLDVLEGEELIKEEKQLLYDKKKIEALEQLVEDHILLAKDNVVFTPHIAFFSQEALERIIQKTLDNINNFLNNKIDKESIVC